MGYERYPRGDDNGRRDPQDYGRDYGSGRDYGYSSARDYRAAGMIGRDERGMRGQRDDDRSRDYGAREYGNAGYGRGGNEHNDRGYGQSRYGQSGYGQSSYGRSEYDQGGYGQSNYGQSNYGRSDYGQARGDRGSEYHGSYAHDGRRFEDVGARRHQDDDNYRDRQRGRGDYGRQPQGYDYDDRGFLARAGDEVRSWFGDEDAERRREMDSRYDERYYNQQDRHDSDGDYHSWRSGQIASFDRDYDEYRRENRTKFENEFSAWRTQRQTQRDSLDRVKEHDEVLGSDGSHVGTVDKVRGDRILLTKNDADAGGQHHSIPSRWIDKAEDGKVTLSKTAEEAKQHWRTEEKSQAMFGYGDRGNDRQGADQDRQRMGASSDAATGKTGAAGSDDATGTTGTDTLGGTNLNRSFSGTY